MLLIAFGACSSAESADHAMRYVMDSGWRSVEVAGKEVQIYYPKNTATAPSLRPVIYLHGHSGAPIRGRAPFERVADEHDFVYICPRGKLTWWTDLPHDSFDAQLSAERYIVEKLVPYIRKKMDPRLRTETLALTGISMGGQGSLRLAFRHPDLFPIVVSIAAAIYYDTAIGKWSEIRDMYGTAEAARADTAVHHIDPSRHPARICLLIDPEDWEWIEGNRDFQAKLAELRIEHEFDFKTSNQGHTWNYFYTIAPKMGRYIAQSFEELSPETPGAVLASFDLQ